MEIILSLQRLVAINCDRNTLGITNASCCYGNLIQRDCKQMLGIRIITVRENVNQILCILYWWIWPKPPMDHEFIK